jgi:hypothetical protein
VDASKVIGEIHSFQGLNGPPTPVMAGLPDLVERYKELRVGQVRTHDFMGPSEIDSKCERQLIPPLADSRSRPTCGRRKGRQRQRHLPGLGRRPTETSEL